MTPDMFQPTFLQKLLGQNYKWWYLVLCRFKSRTVSVFDNVFFVVGQLIILAGTMLIWWLANDKNIDANLLQKWNYFIIGELFFGLIFTFAEYYGFGFIRGKHVADLLKPQGFIQMKFFDSIGESSVQNLVKTPIFLIILIIFAVLGLTNLNLYGAMIAILIVPIATAILYLIGIIVACSGFYLPEISGIIVNYGFLTSLLMGRLFPIDLLIPSFWVNLTNPFGYLFYHPMQIYFGKYSSIETIYVFIGGITWSLALYFLAKAVFRAGLKKNESVGL